MRRTAVLALLVIPALAGCLQDGSETMPLLAGLAVDVEDPGGHVAGREVVLEATPVLENTTYAWRLGDEVHPGAVLRLELEPGSYQVVLVATRGGEVVQHNHTFEVAAPVESGDVVEDEVTDEVTAPAPCGFGGESIRLDGRGNRYTLSFPWTCQPDSWEWDLGDGTRSREATVQHEYRRDGDHTVTLTLVHDNETHTYTQVVEVRDVPLRIVPHVVGNEVAFTLEWGRDVKSAEWDLDNDTTSTDLAPSATYPHAGPWTITATATDDEGESATAKRVLSLDSYPLRVVADLHEDTAALSFQWGWMAETVAWSLGPGCRFVAGTDADDPAPVVRCAWPGTHFVGLEVADADRSAVATHALEVEEVPLRIHATVNRELVTVAPVWHGDPKDVTWRFGDGSLPTQASTHRYHEYGTFTIILHARSVDGKPMTAQTQVTITDVPLRVDWNLDQTTNAFDASLIWDVPDSVTWDFGDGADGHTHPGTADDATIQHVYARKGTYTVHVTATHGIHNETWQGEVKVRASLPPDWGDPETKPIRPGIQTSTAGGGQCTASFLFHEDWDRYFLATAAHCVGKPGGIGGQQFSLDCSENDSLDMGTEVTLRDWGAEGRPEGAEDVVGHLAYSSWDTMVREGVSDVDACLGNDFALVEIDRTDLVQVHPAVLWFGGPVSDHPAEGPAPSDAVRSYGASSTRNPGEVGGNHAANAKGGRYETGDDNGGWTHTVRLEPPAIQGDSGGPLLTEGGNALGILSTISADGTNQYTHLARAVEWMRAHGGPDVALVTVGGWDSRLPLEGDDDPLACPQPELCDPDLDMGPEEVLPPPDDSPDPPSCPLPSPPPPGAVSAPDPRLPQAGCGTG